MVNLLHCYIPLLLSLPVVQPGHTQENKPVHIGTLKNDDQAWGLRFSPHGEFLTAVVRTKKKVVRWDLKAMKHQSVLDLSSLGWIEFEAYAHADQRLVTEWAVPAESEHWVRVWNLETGKETTTYHGRDLSRPALSPDGKFLAVIKRDDPLKDRGEVILLDTSTGNQLPVLAKQAAAPRGPDLYSVSFSPDGKTLAISSTESKFERDGFSVKPKWTKSEVKLWDIETRKLRATLTGSVGLMEVSFSPDGKTIATRSWDELSRDRERQLELKLWDAATGNEKFELKGHRAQILSIAFSPDGKVLATGGGTVHLSPITPKVVTGDLSLPVTVAELKLWDVATGKERANLGGHKNPVYVIEVSPDGRLLATASGFTTKPGELRLWDVRTGKQLPAPDGFADGVTSLAFSPDSKVLAVSDGKGAVQLWDVSGVGGAPKR